MSFDNVCQLLAEKYPLDFARWLLPEEPREIKEKPKIKIPDFFDQFCYLSN
ncbi:hypothetical protein MEN41_12510 [Dolichospermum sp. ST_con]|nr:hypothetical protein [Dolichospermum sp. ST_con]MDD1422003.1 hypothetical protein [Dolichospermum sp. ST_sed1]MDD1425951.1 hypothetical protein [Dolichospermum sp. ST_sed9]MDD1429997.1 hypothetical protein [Dolichospermum sp. ST_sed6]MDD1438138.1 hypothetical protein [Dolichospermum sp. ST_sed10]MDD1442103.1 hypothetical protein [Dolichospermum sp. ST_sed3]MDD1447964.1 hypothetical protein [Dolichospermum sp. ST_sed8]MDD1457594.1 hypothetical protein [Dolichospermum sp. ST_sed7]MDD146206